MNAKRCVALLGVFFSVLVAGCVSQGNTVAYPNDVLVLGDFSAAPASVAPSQSVTAKGYVVNKGPSDISDITVSLYDFCPTAFAVEEMKCGTNISRSGSAKCVISKMRPSESSEIWWKLRAAGPEAFGGLGFSCDVKASVAYRYETKTMAPVTIVSQSEYERLSNGFVPQPVQLGYGPVKAELVAKTPQPIIAGSTFDITLTMTNAAGGYVPGKKIPRDSIRLAMPNGFKTKGGCDFELLAESGGMKFYKPGRDMDAASNADALKCQVVAPGEAGLKTAETTFYLIATAQYDYEFRTSATAAVTSTQ